MGLDLGLSKVVIEGDNLSMIKKLHARVIKRSVLKGLQREENTYMLERVPSYAITVTEMDNWRINQASLSV
ncbi:hypothetical protein Gogos_001849 [Gossypium gossypioides]|uniref:RNase H type-1 domain-containing protein n=1 Tax=Gossypium gossypioides TaxID=34282 RepID=A0A7J9CQ08_GOSGO|nr:hypothetical protein [Gossypium gossypioides]